MNCRDFDHIWNRLLDGEPRSRRRDDAHAHSAATRTELETRLREHAAACEECRERHRRFEALRRALSAWAALPQVSAAPTQMLTERVLRAVEPRRRRSRAAASALAAAAVGAAVVVIASFKPSFRPDATLKSPPTALNEPRKESGLLRAAVNNATAASWQLARLTTEPAARLGREMIDASFAFPPREPPVLEMALLEPFPAASTADADSYAPELFSRMGGYLTAGVEPVSTTAREAFGFLRPPTTQ